MIGSLISQSAKRKVRSPLTISLFGVHFLATEYYLGLGKKEVLESPIDILGVTLLNNYSEITWRLVESAVPPIRHSGGGGDSGIGVRTFVGSRSAVADTTFTDYGEDAAGV